MTRKHGMPSHNGTKEYCRYCKKNQPSPHECGKQMMSEGSLTPLTSLDNSGIVCSGSTHTALKSCQITQFVGASYCTSCLEVIVFEHWISATYTIDSPESSNCEGAHYGVVTKGRLGKTCSRIYVMCMRCRFRVTCVMYTDQAALQKFIDLRARLSKFLIDKGVVLPLLTSSIHLCHYILSTIYSCLDELPLQCCVLCKQPLRASEEVSALPKCGHKFHRACLSVLLEKVQACPVCDEMIPDCDFKRYKCPILKILLEQPSTDKLKPSTDKLKRAGPYGLAVDDNGSNNDDSSNSD